MELERGSMSFKIWKAIKVNRGRAPDILCLQGGRRVESRAKTNRQITMPHSLSNPERSWNLGLEDGGWAALAFCERSGEGALDWSASPLGQYVGVHGLRKAWNTVRRERPKGAQEGFEIGAAWPSAVAKTAGMVEEVDSQAIRYRQAPDKGRTSTRLERGGLTLKPLVAIAARVQPNQIIASVVPLTGRFPTEGGAAAGQS